jgi:hypothetical protein
MLPKHTEIEEPLLSEIMRRGGSARPADPPGGRTIYAASAEYFQAYA